MILKEKIIDELKHNNYQSDRELADKILGIGSKQQPVNSACRQLVVEGKIKRTLMPIKNFISSEKRQSSLSDESMQIISSAPKGQYLKEEFNAFWNSFLGTNRDYYSEFTLEKLAELKMAVANINNLITYESTIMAAQIICDILILNEKERKEIISSIESSSANSNGFDIEYSGRIPFVCEVKANIPAGGRDVFGAAQVEQLTKDITSLIDGKSKSHIKSSRIQDYYKFLCLYCKDEKTQKAMRKFVSNCEKKNKRKLEFWGGQEPLDKGIVYILFVVNKN